MDIWSNMVCLFSNNYYRYPSVSEMLQQLGWQTLECWWLEARATVMYKITNNLVHIDQRYLFYNLRNIHGHSLHLYELPTRIDAYCLSFYLLSIWIWNNLPECVISSTKFNVDLFKYNISHELENIKLVIYQININNTRSSGGLYILYKWQNWLSNLII